MVSKTTFAIVGGLMLATSSAALAQDPVKLSDRFAHLAGVEIPNTQSIRANVGSSPVIFEGRNVASSRPAPLSRPRHGDEPPQ